MQKLRERKLGIPADPAAASINGSSARGRVGGGGAAVGEAEKEDLVLQDTFAQETAVTIEDPNMYFAVPAYLVLLAASAVLHLGAGINTAMCSLVEIEG